MTDILLVIVRVTRYRYAHGEALELM